MNAAKPPPLSTCNRPPRSDLPLKTVRDKRPRSPAPPSGRIICQRTDGLGGRLLILLWTLRFARSVDASLLMFWPKLDLFSYNDSGAGDLFDLYRLSSPPFRNRLQIVDGDCRTYIAWSPIRLNRRKTYDPAAFVVPVDIKHWRQALPVIVGHWEGPFLAPGERAAEVMADMPALFGTLPFRRDLMGEVDRVAEERGLSEMVAVHVRRGEIVQNLRAAVAGYRPEDPEGQGVLHDRVGTFARRCMSVDNFAAALRKFVDEGRTILVFSDEPHVHEELGRALGTPDVLAAASLVTGELTGLQQAFVELCLMSRCLCIVGARSAYSLSANVIGANARVDLNLRSRTAADCAALALSSAAAELQAHPHRAQIEQRIQDEIARLHG